MSSAEWRLKMDHKIQPNDAASAVRPVGSESKEGPSTTTASQAESLSVAEKRDRTNTDLGERKRAEEAIRANEQSLRLIVDSIPGFVSIMNAAGEVELQNRQVLEYTGKTAEEMKNWAASDTLHPDDLPHVIDAWRCAIETGEPIDLEHRSRGVDGVYRWFHARGRPQRDAEGRIIRWYNLVTDIDERKRAEDELRKAFEKIAKSEAELRTIIDLIPQLITAVGADGNFLY
jgi:PAS domain S-box-containing protein